VRTFTTKKGDEGKVSNFVLADDTSNIKVVLWDVNHIALIEKGDIKLDSVVEIVNGSMRDNEIHLGSFSEFKISDKVLDNVQTAKIVKEKNIADFRLGDNSSVRAFIVQAFDPKFWHACPECNKKTIQEGEGFMCKEHGKVVPEKRALISIVLDDGTETIRSTLFHDLLGSIGLTDLENPEMLLQQRQNLLGKEMVFSGTVKNNSFFNTTEFNINGVDEVNLDDLVSKLEGKN
jgi:ssDNA-binding replication factor A large subunit